MIFDPEIARKRSHFLQKTRDFFNRNNFLEVETPIMTVVPDPAPHLSPFETFLHYGHGDNFKKIPMFLNTSPEFQMKKLLGSGAREFHKIYNLTKVFRNGELGGGRHNPEFTMIEWYRRNANYTDIMEDCENLICHLQESDFITYQAQKIDIKKPWERVTCRDLFLKFCQIDLNENKNFETFQKTAQTKKCDTNGCKDWDDLFYKLFLNEIEPHLGITKPIFVCDYPSSQAALSIKKADDPFWSERFELYIAGQELANAYSELIDPLEQRKRFEEQLEMRKKSGKTVFDIDEEFLASLESITDPCGGIALGIDRLLQILMDKKTIEETLLFPMYTMLSQADKL